MELTMRNGMDLIKRNVMKLNRFIWLQLLLLATLVSVASAQQTEEGRLDIGSPTDAVSKIEVEGLVSKVNKYSIEVTSDQQTWLVGINNNTNVVLKCSSPRIDFEKSETWIAIEGSEKKFKSYKFKTPLDLQARFNHQNQFKRIMSGDVKRFPNYSVGNKPFPTAGNRKQILLNGSIEKGDTGRQLKLTTDAGVPYQILLSKNGEWHGFSVTDLVAGATKVRVGGQVNQDQQINATRILFWPTKSSAQPATSNQPASGSNNR